MYVAGMKCHNEGENYNNNKKRLPHRMCRETEDRRQKTEDKTSVNAASSIKKAFVPCSRDLPSTINTFRDRSFIYKRREQR